MSGRDEASFPNSEQYTVEDIVDHARFDDLYFRKLMYLKNHHPATDKIMGNFVAQIKKGERCSKYFYRTRWAGYRPDEDTWEPEANFWISNSSGKIEANESLITYKNSLGLKGHQLSEPQFTSQTAAENLTKFGLPAKIYEELSMRFEIWAKIKNKSSLNENVLQKPQIPSKLGEHEKGQQKKKRSSLEMDSNESESSTASCLKKLRAQKAQATANALQEAYKRVNSDFLPKSTNDEQLPNRKPLKRNTRKKPQSTSSNSSDPIDKSEDESSQSSDGQSFYFETPVAETYALMKTDERKKKQNELNRIYKNVNDEEIGSGEEKVIDTNNEVQQKTNLPAASEVSIIEPLQKDPIKPKIGTDPLEKVVTCRSVDRAQKQTVYESKIRSKNVINTVHKDLQEENDILIIEEKPCEKNNLRNKESEVVTGYFKFSMTPFLAMPYQRRRTRSCGAAMTDGGVSFVKELEESYAKEHRWNALLKRGVRSDSTEQVYRLGKQIRLTQIRRDGVVRYACAEKGTLDHLRKIGHVISKPVPLREIDMDLVEKNEVSRKKKNVAGK